MLSALVLAALLAETPAKPLPESTRLIADVRAHQKHMDELRENSAFRELVTTDELDARGAVRRTTAEEREIFFVNAHRIDRVVKRDGKDLNPADRKSEDERVKHEAQKYAKSGVGENREMVALTQILGIMNISAPHRAMLNGRATLAFDFTGDPDAKTHGMAEKAAKKIAGTVWIDEADRDVVRLEARFDDVFRVGGGLFASIQKGTSVVFEQSRLGEGFWMPSNTEIHLAAREFLVNSVRRNIHVKDFDFQRFGTSFEERHSAPAQ